jgi:hypothetical protein
LWLSAGSAIAGYTALWIWQRRDDYRAFFPGPADNLALRSPQIWVILTTVILIAGWRRVRERDKPRDEPKNAGPH